ncbi:transposase [Streptomyces sp. NPDC046557]|uniref:transposase n=1 Tax=Streptomyces sp. NPDC046557 TaxID=3155372 RepID=UPI0033C77E95
MAYETGITSRNELQKVVYARLKTEFRLAAQPAVRTVKKVVDAYTTLSANIRAGGLGTQGSNRRRRAESKPIRFRSDAAQPYDDRILSWRHEARTVTSDGDKYQGRRLARYRRWHARKRAELQVKQTRSATRRVNRRAKREARHATHVNHEISEEIVAVARRTGRGIALEELSGIRDRVRPSRDQRAALSSWPFHQLEEHIRYKAQRAGVPVVLVDAHYTSQMCPRCGHTARHNRPTRDTFPLSSVRARRPRRSRRRGQRAQPRALGVGYRQRTRTTEGLASLAGRCDP